MHISIGSGIKDKLNSKDSNSYDMWNVFDENSEGDYNEIVCKDNQNVILYIDWNINYNCPVTKDIEIAENL